jgi:hypothetical protein
MLSTIPEVPSPGLAVLVASAVMDELNESPEGRVELTGWEFMATRVSGKLSEGLDAGVIPGFELGGSRDGFA